MPNYQFSGKVFFVTGGAQGIGKGIIEEVLSKHVKVYFVDIKEDVGRATQSELESKFGHDSIGFSVCDVTDRQRFEECFDRAVSKFGNVDVMVNNAGVLGEQNAKRVIDINLTGMIYGTEIAMQHMRKDEGGRGGRIINMSSVAGLRNELQTPVYCASKHGVRAYTQSLALNPFIEETGIEFATLHPDGAEVGIPTNMEPEDLLYSTRYIPEIVCITLSRAVQGFVHLLTLEKMNGVALRVTHDSIDIMKTESFAVGESYSQDNKV